MRWEFTEATDMEAMMVEWVMPRSDNQSPYNLDITVENPDPGVHLYTDSGAPFDTTIEHHARIVNCNWDGWEIMFALLDDDYEPTGDFITLSSELVTVRI